jgi:hypothetical protein
MLSKSSVLKFHRIRVQIWMYLAMFAIVIFYFALRMMATDQECILDAAYNTVVGLVVRLTGAGLIGAIMGMHLVRYLVDYDSTPLTSREKRYLSLSLARDRFRILRWSWVPILLLEGILRAYC